MRALLLRNNLALGDNVVLTAAVRDLVRACPGELAFDVRCPSPDVWLNNPHLTPMLEQDPGIEEIEVECPMVDLSNDLPRHFLEGFGDFLGRHLGRGFELSEFRGDIHLTRCEREHPGRIAQLLRSDTPYWLIATGGKMDLTIKWWSYRRYQEVVDIFRDRILFVQVGEDTPHHYHPPLRGALDLRGRTSARDLVHLMYHAEGVLCGVTALMHLAAAVPVRPDRPSPRPCVVVAGGREPVHWEAYPGHQYLHTVGALPCCAAGGCWRSRTFPLGDGTRDDDGEQICVNVVHDLPRCMDLITAEDVARAVERYFDGEQTVALTAAQAARARPLLRKEVPQRYA